MREDILVQTIKTQKYKKKLVQKALRVDDEEEMAQEIKCDRDQKRYKWPKSFSNMQDSKGMRSFRWSCPNQQFCFRK